MGKFILSLLFGVLALGLFAIPQNVQAADVTIDWSAGSPNTSVEIFVGDTVTWEFNDSVTRTVDSTGGPESFSSGSLTGPGVSFLHTFNQVGTVTFEDNLNSGLQGSVTVLPEPTLIINEILPRPAGGLQGDANCDGTRDAQDDEFVELFNLSSGIIDLDGYSLIVDGNVRHVFSPLVLQPGDSVLVFGGGTPTFDGSSSSGTSWCTETLPSNVNLISAGTDLQLLDTGSTITIRDDTGDLLEDV